MEPVEALELRIQVNESMDRVSVSTSKWKKKLENSKKDILKKRKVVSKSNKLFKTNPCEFDGYSKIFGS